MARENYSFRKRQKEIARKKKMEKKRQRKLDKKNAQLKEKEGEAQVPSEVISEETFQGQ